MHAQPVILRIGGFRQSVVLDISGDSHDRAPMTADFQVDLLAERALMAEQTAGQSGAQNERRLAGSALSFGEGPPGNNRNAQCAEVSRSHPTELDHSSVRGYRRVPRNAQVRVRASHRAAWRYRVTESEEPATGDALQSPFEFVEEAELHRGRADPPPGFDGHGAVK